MEVIRNLDDTVPKKSRRFSVEVEEARDRAMKCFAELDELEDSVNNGNGGAARLAILDRLGQAIMDMEATDVAEGFEEEI